MTAKSLVQRVTKYTVFSLDMWGHVPADCLEHRCESCVMAHDCAACKGDGILAIMGSFPCEACKGVGQIYEHDDNACDCHEDCNQQFKIGEIQVRENDTDACIIQTLVDDGFLTSKATELAEIRDYSGMGEYLDIEDRDGRRILALEKQENDES